MRYREYPLGNDPIEKFELRFQTILPVGSHPRRSAFAHDLIATVGMDATIFGPLPVFPRCLFIPATPQISLTASTM